jgi:hypothetical protein
MATVQQPISDMLVTVKSREIQRGILAEMRQDREAATRHFLAAAHLELVLANDYAQAGETALATRSRISAASCLWRAGQPQEARTQFEALLRESPSAATSVQQALRELEGGPGGTSA